MKSRQRKSRELDRTDRLILKHLQEDGRISNVALARKVNLSPTPCMERVRRRVNGRVLPMLGHQLEDARASASPDPDWQARLSAEIDRLRSDGMRLPWQDGLPAATAASR